MELPQSPSECEHWIRAVAGRQGVALRYVKLMTKDEFERHWRRRYTGPPPFGYTDTSGRGFVTRSDLSRDHTVEIMIHELAHVELGEPKLQPGRKRRRDIHSWEFWETFWRIAIDEGVEDIVRPYVWMARGIKIARKRGVEDAPRARMEA